MLTGWRPQLIVIALIKMITHWPPVCIGYIHVVSPIAIVWTPQTSPFLSPPACYSRPFSNAPPRMAVYVPQYISMRYPFTLEYSAVWSWLCQCLLLLGAQWVIFFPENLLVLAKSTWPKVVIWEERTYTEKNASIRLCLSGIVSVSAPALPEFLLWLPSVTATVTMKYNEINPSFPVLLFGPWWFIIETP